MALTEQAQDEKPVEGFWLVQFSGIRGMGWGTVTLVGGKIFGGDSGFLYTGSYQQQKDELTASVHVAAIFPGAQNVMGLEEFDLTLTSQTGEGLVEEGFIEAAGSIPGTSLSFQAVLRKQSSL